MSKEGKTVREDYKDRTTGKKREKSKEGKEKSSSALIKGKTNGLKKRGDAISQILHNKNQFRSEFDLIGVAADGLTKASIDELAMDLGISRKSMAEDILNVSVKTMERKSPEDKLDKKLSSHAIEIARTIQHAFRVFEDEEKVKRWVIRENKALNGMKPIRLFDTLTGLNLVNDILGRIEEGVYS